MPLHRLSILLFVLLAVIAAACGGDDGTASNTAAPASDARVERLKRIRTAIEPFFEPMQIRDGDWLKSQRETGETFEEYLASDPPLPTDSRRTIYILPVGSFSGQQRRAIETAAKYMRAFYNLPVRELDEIKLGTVPREMQRRLEFRNNLQIRTEFFLEELLPQRLPDDGAALIAFTNYDLYPSETWAFVFGQASLKHRVGVWSLYRFADMKTGRYDDRLLTDRTLKIAMHETGHMFGMKHCIKYECLMSGTNHLAETDRRPSDNCPECMAKLAWAMDYDPVERYRNLEAFWKKQGRPDEAQLMARKAKAAVQAR
jgi:archaemetzincin